MNEDGGMQCPLPQRSLGDAIDLAHGEGGPRTRQLLREEVFPWLKNDLLMALGDSAVLPPLSSAPVFTTDSYVVSPLFFPGGNIGSLAVFGTVNDLAVAGGKPRWISLSLILEEGFERADFRQVLRSIAAAARETEVAVVTGDTKVVPRGAVDRLFINTAGIGELQWPLAGPAALQPGDGILVSGPIGRHGLCILAAREELGFDPPLASDCGSLLPAIDALRQANVPVRAMRDATRGGVAAVLHEWAAASGLSIVVESGSIPLTPEVRGASELLGLDPLFVACEGTLVAAVPHDRIERATEVLRRIPLSAHAAPIAELMKPRLSPVLLRQATGQLVPLDEPLHALLPRIC